SGTAHSVTPVRATLPDEYEALRQYLHQPPQRVYVDWPDGGAPPFEGDFLRELPELVLKATGGKGGHVIINCVGGHGRTGTALAGLAILHNNMSAKEAVEHVRECHCKKAVETKVQVAWLCQLAGRGEIVVDDKDDKDDKDKWKRDSDWRGGWGD